MNFFKSNFNPNPLPIPQPENLQRLSSNLNTRQITIDNLNIYQFTKHRHLDDIMRDIENNNCHNITLLEWVYCLFNKAKFDQEYPHKSMDTSQKIWQYCQNYSPLKSRLFYRLILFKFNPKEEVLAFSLTDTCPSFQPQTEDDIMLVTIVNFIFSKSYQELANICIKELLQPNQLLKKYNLPSQFTIEDNLTLIEAIQISFPFVLKNIKNLSKKQINFFIETLNILSPHAQLKTIENLLNNLSSEKGVKYPSLVTWLKNNYGLTVDNSRWNELSLPAKNALKKWIGAVNYRDFEKLVNLLIQHLDIDEKEKERLRSRKDFWSNYSNHFQRLKILLPPSSLTKLDDNITLDDIYILEEDNQEISEVCIFDFGQYFIVEIFRGIGYQGSETRLFPKTEFMEKNLFLASHLSIKKIRSYGGEIHDHVFCWQTFCEKWLKKYDIYPNFYPNNGYFFGLSKKYGKYDTITGLPEPSQENLIIRKRKLNEWQNNMNKLANKTL